MEENHISSKGFVCRYVKHSQNSTIIKQTALLRTGKTFEQILHQRIYPEDK